MCSGQRFFPDQEEGEVRTEAETQATCFEGKRKRHGDKKTQRQEGDPPFRCLDLGPVKLT